MEEKNGILFKLKEIAIRITLVVLLWVRNEWNLIYLELELSCIHENSKKRKKMKRGATTTKYVVEASVE